MFGYSPPLHLTAQAPPDGMQHVLWAFSRMPPELADANMDIKVHHAFGSATLNLTCTAAELSDDDMGGNRDGDRADGRSTPSPSDAAKWGRGRGQGGRQVDAVAIGYCNTRSRILYMV